MVDADFKHFGRGRTGLAPRPSRLGHGPFRVAANGNAGHGNGAARIGLADHQLAPSWPTQYWALTTSQQYRHCLERLAAMWHPHHSVGLTHSWPLPL
jgi:hypothetical protein